MKIEMLGKRTILVSLPKEDMYRYALCGEKKPYQVEAGLRSLLYHVGEVCGLDHRRKSYLVEALPAREGCLLIISVRSHRRVYRVKRTLMHDVCVFFDADAMLDFMKLKQRMSGAFYRCEERYLFIPALSSSERLTVQLSEFGTITPLSPVMQARIAEYGTLLRQEDVHRRHICSGAVAVGDTALRDPDGAADDLGEVGAAG